MRTLARITAAIAGFAALSSVAGAAHALTAAERCEAYQLAASGARISAKLHCRAWAKLTGTPLDPACLDRAEKRFFLHLQEGGTDCATPDAVVSLGAAADEQMNVVVEDLDPDAPVLPDLTGDWHTRTSVAIDPNGDPTLGCELGVLRPCPHPDAFAVVECDTRLEQDGDTLRFESSCYTPADSRLQLGPFTQQATGTVDAATGEWTLAGTVSVPTLPVISYSGEGVFSLDGRSQTGFSTAGWSSGSGSLWLATTTGRRVD